MNTFQQTDIKRSYGFWFTLDFRKLIAKNVKFWQIPRLFRGNLQIPRKIVNSAENTKIRDFFLDHWIAEFWRACHIPHLHGQKMIWIMNWIAIWIMKFCPM